MCKDITELKSEIHGQQKAQAQATSTSKKKKKKLRIFTE